MSLSVIMTVLGIPDEATGENRIDLDTEFIGLRWMSRLLISAAVPNRELHIFWCKVVGTPMAVLSKNQRRGDLTYLAPSQALTRNHHRRLLIALTVVEVAVEKAVAILRMLS
jgi:hypothetical protein